MSATSKRRPFHIPIISLAPDFFAALPAMLLALFGIANWVDAPMDLLQWKVTLPMGLPIFAGVIVGWATGIYCGWTLSRNLFNERVRIAKGMGELDALIANPEARRQVEAIVGPMPL